MTQLARMTLSVFLEVSPWASVINGCYSLCAGSAQWSCMMGLIPKAAICRGGWTLGKSLGHWGTCPRKDPSVLISLARAVSLAPGEHCALLCASALVLVAPALPEVGSPGAV